MSQEKVDKRKYEKYHRKEIQRKQKIKNTICIVIAVLILGTAIGIPLGYKIYDSIPKKISDIVFNAWVSNYVQGLDGYPFVVTEDTTEENTSEDETSDSTQDNENTDTSEDGTDTTQADTSEEASDTAEADTSEDSTDIDNEADTTAE